MDDENIFHELLDRFLEPWCWSFVIYFVVVILFLGGAGIWVPIMKEDPFSMKSFITNIVTYSCALIAPSLASIILSITNTKNKVSLSLLILATCCIVLFVVGYSVVKESLFGGIVCFVLSILSWIIANYDNEELSDSKFNEKVKKNANSLTKDWK